MRKQVDSFPITVNDAFWPLFFTSRLMTRIVGACVCFCLTDQDNKQQLILVVPEGPRVSIPTLVEIMNSFPVHARGERKYLDPHSIPADYTGVRALREFVCHEVQTKNRVVRILAPPTAVSSTQAPKRLLFYRFWKAESLHLARLYDMIGEERLWYETRETGDSRAIVMLHQGESFFLRGQTVALKFGDIPGFVQVAHESFTA